MLTFHYKSLGFALLLSTVIVAQNPPQPPQVRVNYLNVCTPSDADKQEIAAALSRIPGRPLFAPDFEVARGRSSMDESSIIAGAGAQMQDGKPSTSRWVRIRREFSAASAFSNAQYSFSTSEGRVSETLVFRIREPKDLLQVSLSAAVDAPADPAQVAALSTLPDRIRVERFGKSSVVLARCKEADQASYEPLFKTATSLFATYRTALNVQKTVPGDLAKIGPAQGGALKAGLSSAEKTAPAKKKK